MYVLMFIYKKKNENEGFPHLIETQNLMKENSFTLIKNQDAGGIL